jgi:hypothetical protein
MVGMNRLIDDWLPRFDETELHSTEVAAPPAAVEAALRGLCAGDLPLTRLLMGLRTLPGRLASRGVRYPPRRRTLIDGMLAAGFVVLDDRPGEQLVLGVVGRPWQLRGDGLDTLDGPQAFRGYSRPGSVRAAMDFTIEPAARGTRLSTETRIAGTDAAGTRTFRRYWRIVHPGSALIRRDLLHAVRSRAAKRS